MYYTGREIIIMGKFMWKFVLNLNMYIKEIPANFNAISNH